MGLDMVTWLPMVSVQVTAWAVTLGSPTPTDGIVAVVPGAVVSAVVAMGDGSALPSDERTVTVAGVTTPLPLDGMITDQEFLSATVGSAQQGSTNGVDFSLQASGAIELAVPLTVLAVPPVALFGLTGTTGCVQVGDEGIPVRVVGSSLGVSLISPVNGSTPTTVAIGAGITKTDCS